MISGSVLTVAQVFRVAAAIGGRYRVLVLLAAFTSHLRRSWFLGTLLRSLPSGRPRSSGSTTRPTASPRLTAPPWWRAESGYGDQSHLHRDVMAFAGMTPTVVAIAGGSRSQRPWRGPPPNECPGL